MLRDLGELIERRGNFLFREHCETIYRRTDRLFAGLMLLQWAAAIAAAYWLSPLTWMGRLTQTHVHVWAAWLLGGAITLLPVALAVVRPGRTSTRHIVAAGQMTMSALLIHLSGGRLETHFHVFGSLAFLAFYRDWLVFIPATALVAADHFLRGLYWPESVYGVLTAGSWRWLEHAAWVLFEDAFLIHSCLQSLREMRDIAWHRAELEVANERTEHTVVLRTAELQASEERFRSLSEASPIGIFQTDAAGAATYVNDRWSEIAGISTGEALGDGWSKAVHPDDREAVIDTWMTAVRAGRESTVEFRIVTPGGDERWVSARTKPLTSAGGTLTGHVGTLEDVSVRKMANVELAEARDRALETARLKSEFLANMSHEIRTPMNAIIGMTDMTLDTELTDEQRDYLETVKLSSRALLTLINDILDLSKIESGRMTLDSAPFMLRESLGDTLRTLAVRAHQKGLELACDVAADVPDAAIGDAGRLRQIVINLVGNAIKFTDRGEVVIRVRTRSIGTQDMTLCFSVSDTGIGIPNEKQSIIFAPFVQADGSMTRQYGGTGLGLTIANQLVEMMGGTMSVGSAVGHGSTFNFTLRLGRGEETRSPVVPEALENIRVLVVDDNVTIRNLLVEIVASWGMTAVGLGDAPSALMALRLAHQRGEPFDLALIDAHMPDPDGVTVAQAIQSAPDLAGTRIILLTAAGMPMERGSALRGVVYLAKPIARSHLLEAIQKLRDGHVAEPAARRPTIEPAARPLRVLMAEDNATNRKVTAGLLKKRGHRVVAVEDGRAAVDALARESFDVVVMDVQMPGMDGLEATAAIRTRESTEGRDPVPIVALTAHAMAGDRVRCLRAGMNAYVSKPVEADELFAAIENVTRGASRDSPVVARDRPTTVLDRDAMLRRVDGDADLLLEMVETFTKESATLLEEIRGAITRNDATRLTRVAHSLKGALRTLAAPAASEVARQLETMARDGDLTGAEEGWRALEREMIVLRAALSTVIPSGTPAVHRSASD